MTTVNPPRVRVEREDAVLVITLDRPAARNAIDHQAAVEIEAALDWLESDDELRVAVLAATGPAFCAGADIRALAAGGKSASTDRGGFAGITERDLAKPVIAAVGGPALGGGFEIVLACDMVVADSSASFALPEVTLGLIATAGGLLRLPLALALPVAMSMALTGRRLSAERAYELGLVTDMVAEGEALLHATELARRIASFSADAVQWARRVVRASAHDPSGAGSVNAAAMEALIGSAGGNMASLFSGVPSVRLSSSSTIAD